MSEADPLYKFVEEEFNRLSNGRGVWEDHWQEIVDYTMPRKTNINTKEEPGSKRGEALFDSTATHSIELLAGALHSLLTNPYTDWFEMTTGDEELDNDDEVKLWRQEVATKMLATMNASNFQTEIHEFYLDLLTIGTPCLAILEDDDKDVRFSSRFISEVLIDEDEKEVVNRVLRTYEWRAQQLHDFLEESERSDKLKEQLLKDPNKKLKIRHYVFPKHIFKGRDVNGTNKNKPFASVYTCCELKEVVKEGGFRTYPYAVARWSKLTGEVYGRSPSMTALPETKMINEMMRTIIIGAQKTIDPPVQVPSEGYILPVRLHPGGINIYDPTQEGRIEPILKDVRIDFGFQMLNEIRAKIRQAYFVDQLQLNQGPQMTATEVNTRTEERLRLLGPILGRLQNELLRVTVDRVFEIMFFKGRFSQPPEVLQGKVLDVRYASTIAKLQRMSEAENVVRFLNSLGPVAQFDQDILQNIDGDEYTRYQAKMHGVPAKILRPQEDVMELREAAVQGQEQAAEQEAQSAEAQSLGQILPGVAQLEQAQRG